MEISTTSAIAWLILAVVLLCLSCYWLGDYHGSKVYWYPEAKPPVKPEADPYAHVEPGESSAVAEFLDEGVTTAEIPSIDTALALASEVLPELGKQTKLANRYRREARSERKKNRGSS